MRPGLLHSHPAQAPPGHAPGAHAVPMSRVQQVLPLPQPAAEPHPQTPERAAVRLHRVRHGVQPDPPPQAALAHPQGCEGVQVRGVWARVHAAGQHEAAHVDPHQRAPLSVPHLLQDLCAEADAQDPHDCAFTRQAIQVQGVWEVLQPHVQPPGPHAPARRQQAFQVPLLLQQVQPEGEPQSTHESQARRDGYQPGQPRSHAGAGRHQSLGAGWAAGDGRLRGKRLRLWGSGEPQRWVCLGRTDHEGDSLLQHAIVGMGRAWLRGVCVCAEGVTPP